MNIGYIYELSFLNDVYKYVGSTKNDVNIRYKQHINELIKGTHGNTFMKNIYNKYKTEPIFKILCEIEDCNIEKLLKKEQEYIDSGDFNLNICKIAGAPQAVKVKVIQYDLDGNYIKVWESTKEASLSLNINATTIRNCTYGLCKSAGKFQWRKWSDNFSQNIGKLLQTKPIPPVIYKKLSIYDLYGNLIKVCNTREEVSNIIGVSKKTIGKYKNIKCIKNYYICDSDLYSANFIEIPVKRVGKYNMKGELVKIFNEPTQAMNEIGKPNTHIFAVLNNKQKSCFGYTYRYIETKIINKINI